MNNRLTTVALPLTALLTAAAALWMTVQSTGPATPTRPLAPGSTAATAADRSAPPAAGRSDPISRTAVHDGFYGAATGSQLGMAIEYATRTELRADRADQAQVLELSAEGRLELLVLDRRGTELLARVRFTGLGIRGGDGGGVAEQTSLRNSMLLPLDLRMDADGRVTGLRFAPEARSANVRGMWRALLAATSAVVPAGAAEAWETREPDTTGLAKLTYTREADKFTRRKTGYVQGATTDVTPSVDGEGRFTGADSIAWIGELDWTEHVRIGMPEAGLGIEATNRAAARLVDAILLDPATLPAADWDGPWSSLDGADDLEDAGADLEREAWEERLRGESLASLTATIEQLLAAESVDGQAMFEAQELLMWLLRTQPEALLDLELLLGRTDLDPFVAAVLLNAAGAAGTDACQGLVAQVLADPMRSDALRVAAVRATFEVGSPSAEMRDAVASLAAAPGADAELVGTGLLALGAFASVDDGSIDRLLGLQDVARDRDLTIDWLEALGNSARPEVLEAAAPHLTDTDPAVRRAAVDALRALDGESVRGLLTDRARNDAAPAVRASAAGLLAERISNAALTTVAGLLQNEPESLVREAALVGLSRNVEPRALELLRTASTSDPDPRLRQLAAELLGR